MDINIDLKGTGISEEIINNMENEIIQAHKKLYDKSGKGSDFLGWVNWPLEFDKDEFERILIAGENIKNSCDILLVIGIGGSYLGSKAVIDAIKGSFYNDLNNELNNETPKLFFVGNNISGRYLSDILKLIDKKDICINVISKSGTTTEPAVAFRILKKHMEEKYGKKEASKRIYVTTDKSSGALRTLADIEGYESFIIGDDIGGRYSVITPVGLLPMAAMGLDIREFMEGAFSGHEEYKIQSIKSNICYKYVAYRNFLYRQGKKTEIMVNYEPSFAFFSEWWKQLYGESEGKEGKGIFPTSVNFTTDLHSMGQYIQEGERNIFETVIKIENVSQDLNLPFDENNLDGLNYLQGKSMDYINKMAMQGTYFAHIDGGVPNCVISIEKNDCYTIGKLVYFFMMSCGISGYLLGINPFNQPGVEAYKKNMFALLDKPGYEDLKKELLNLNNN